MSLTLPPSSVVCCPVCKASHLPPVGRDLKNGVYAATCEKCGFFFKFRAREPTNSSVTFTINGNQYTVGNDYSPATSLNEYLRSSGISTGTKQMCIEGGCGVCLVAVSLFNPISKSVQVYTVNSCLVQLYMCDGWEITTIEGLGNPRDGLHPIQERLATYNGSQCGFCSPAQVMNMYGLLKRNPHPTMKLVEDNFDCTICRCTGYRSILDAMKSFCIDAKPSPSGGPVDIEDLDAKICKKTGVPCSGSCQKSKSSIISEWNGYNSDAPIHIVSDRAQWFKPVDTSTLYSLLNQYRTANYRLVFGNTGFGVYKDIGPWLYDVLIDLRGISTFYSVQMEETVKIGANVSLTNLLELFETVQEDSLPYFPAFALHLRQVATNTIRNSGSWAGSLMLKHIHPDFVSDIFTILETVGTQIVIADADSQEGIYSLTDFLNLDMRGKVITAAILPRYTDINVHISTFRVSQRLQNCHGYVTSGFNMTIDPNKNYTVTSRPTLVFQGINSKLNHATNTEEFLEGKELGNPQVLKDALQCLGQELNPDSSPVLASPQYRRTLAQALFYRFVLNECPNVVDQRFKSGATFLERPVSSAVQTYDTHKEEWPVTEPMTKREAVYQTSGVTRFLDDQRPAQSELYAAFVLSTVGNAVIDTVDASQALQLPGVYRYIQATDFPAGGENNFMPQSQYSMPEEIFSSGKILFAGQPIGLIVADDTMTAETAASLVKVTYKDVQPPLLNLDEAIKQKSFFPGAPNPLIVGDPDAAIKGSPRRISGSIECGTQYHFQLETQIARCCLNDSGGIEVEASTQWIDGTCEIVAKVLNIPQSSVMVEVKRLGGAFGSKISRNFQVSGACALAAYIMQQPVRLRMGFHDNMKAIGKRFPFHADYEVGFTEDGLLNGIKIFFYADCGSSPNENSVINMYIWMDNAYHCDNWNFTPALVKTNKPSNAYCRSPGSVPAQFIMESIMEHVAKTINKDPSEVRKLNLYQKGQTSAGGMKLDYCIIRDLVAQLEASSDLAVRKKTVEDYNKANRWKKRGLSLVPTRFGLVWRSGYFNVFVAIYHSDGTIVIEHGGIEVGQGINQKVAQVCAYELGVPLNLIRVQKGSSVTNANSMTTGGSITSELNCLGVVNCCEQLKERMALVRQKMKNPTWQQLVTACYQQGVDLCARFMTNPQDKYDCHYNVYGAAVTEAEIDVLTGQSQLLRCDILFDCGESINPEIDIGQIEGGFVMGLGYHLTEKMKYDPDTGVALTAGTWEYKPPMAKNLPIDFRLDLLKNAPNPMGVLGSKGSGEPPLVMSSSALFAIKHAAEAARAEIGQDVFFSLNSPSLVEDVQTICLLDASQMLFS
ncbi:xanthine dehydrogenase-like [Pomacea canaliculata]|uniref:xanthine dehydrogenase-like n=1 Tax=Pomacea canaliculata TaxID=400727 RepID=UPI000D72C204|nr:xanthine dehydrogenase-like [Pomacea canaliculata]